jgi:hypothetical protein
MTGDDVSEEKREFLSDDVESEFQWNSDEKYI